MDPYETLGVDRTAADADIKRAYKRKASRAHPDRKTGDAKQMAEVNRAYDLLCTPERRKAFDETGATGPVQTFETKVDTVVMQAFAAEINSPGNMAEAAHRRIQLGQQQRAQQAAMLHDEIAKLARRRKNVRKTGAGANLAHRVIDEKLQQMKQAKAAMAEQMDVLKEAAARVREYKEDNAQVFDHRMPGINAIPAFLR